MYLGIKYKVLLTLVVVTTGTVLVMWLLVKWSFDRGFLRYVSSMERAAQQELVTALGQEYQRSGGWERLRRNPFVFQELQTINFLRIQWRRHGGADWPDWTAVLPGAPFFIAGPPGVTFSQRLPPPIRPTVLLDADRRPVIGRLGRAEELDLLPIEVAGREVGFLGIRPPPGLTDSQDLYFSERHRHALMAIALLVLALSAIMAWPLSRHLVRPIRELSEGTRRLAAGEYDTRLARGAGDELGQLAEDFNTLAGSLRDQERSRRRWIADISHELRTPLSILQGEIEAMQDGIRPASPERLQVLHNETANLTRLVGDVYELSLSDAGALSYQKRPLELEAVITACVAAHQDKFAARGIELAWLSSCDAPVTVMGDADRLKQLFSNLLANSLRYTDPGGRVEVGLGRRAGLAVVDVRDSAPAVPAEHLPHLFERLYRVDASRSRATGGSGLGLSICRSIIEAHGGRISAQASSLGGLWIQVELPLATPV
ncbi:MAG: HAMP domain-containing protein [Gammaproteobacteria bacterium]|nr:HAMP domain-containing protein [Gammaproteobacteria bacterium]